MSWGRRIAGREEGEGEGGLYAHVCTLSTRMPLHRRRRGNGLMISTARDGYRLRVRGGGGWMGDGDGDRMGMGRRPHLVQALQSSGEQSRGRAAVFLRRIIRLRHFSAGDWDFGQRQTPPRVEALDRWGHRGWRRWRPCLGGCGGVWQRGRSGAPGRFWRRPLAGSRTPLYGVCGWVLDGIMQGLGPLNL